MRVWGSKNHSLSYLDKSCGFHSATDLEEGLGVERRCGCLLNTYYVLGAPCALHHLVIPEVERIVLTLLPTQQMKTRRLREMPWLAQWHITGKRLCWDLNPRAWAEFFFLSLYHVAHAWVPLCCEFRRGCFLELRLEFCEISSLTNHRASLGSWPSPPPSDHHQSEQWHSQCHDQWPRKTLGPCCGPLVLFIWSCRWNAQSPRRHPMLRENISQCSISGHHLHTFQETNSLF